MIWRCSKYSLGKYLMRCRPISRPDYSPATKNLHKNVLILEHHNNSKLGRLSAADRGIQKRQEESKLWVTNFGFPSFRRFSRLKQRNPRWPIFLISSAKIKKNPWPLKMLSNLADIPIHWVCLFWRRTSEWHKKKSRWTQIFFFVFLSHSYKKYLAIVWIPYLNYVLKKLSSPCQKGCV